jgi:hypothetical protein
MALRMPFYESNRLTLYLAGSGKSILASQVIQHLQDQSHSATSAICFAYFTVTNVLFGSSGALILALFKQLCRQQKRIPEWLLCVKREDRDPQEYATIGNFLKLTASYSERFIIIDGLDECSDTGRKSVLDFINDLRFCQPIFKIFLTSRKKSDIARYFDREGILQVTTGSEGTTNDINCLIQQKTESLRQSHELLIESDLLFEKVVSVLVGVVCRPVEQSPQLKQVIRWVEPRVSKSWYLDSYYQTASWLFFSCFRVTSQLNGKSLRR